MALHHPLLAHLSEWQLQSLVRIALHDPSRLWQDVEGRALHILSVGEWNHGDGPDFLNIALFADGVMTVGDGEFHRCASEWHRHAHHTNPRYNGLLLHIVLDNDTTKSLAAYTLVLPEEELLRAYHHEHQALSIFMTQLAPQLLPQPTLPRAVEKLPQVVEKRTQPSASDVQSALVVLRDYAQRRIAANHAEACRLLDEPRTLPLAALSVLIQRFLERQYCQHRQDTHQRKTRHKAPRRRPSAVQSAEALMHRLDDILASSAMGAIVRRCTEQSQILTPQILEAQLSSLLQHALLNEGRALRTEIAVNAFLPLLFACTDISLHPTLWSWFWSLPAPHQYGYLKRRFWWIPQNNVWHQQGLLAYLSELRCRQPIIMTQSSHQAQPTRTNDLTHYTRQECYHDELRLTIYSPM